MSTCKVCYVNIVTDTGSVACIIIISEYLKLTLTKSSFHYTWKKIFRFLFESANFSFRIVTCSVEVTEGCKLESLKLVIPVHKLFNLKLSKAIVVDWFLRMIFIHWKVLWFTKSCSRRRENHDFAVVLYSCIHDVQSTCNVVDGILFRCNHRFTGSLECSKVNKSIKTTLKSLVQVALNQNISIDKIIFWKKVAAKAAGKVIEYSYFVSSLHHFFYNVASDVSGTTNY